MTLRRANFGGIARTFPTLFFDEFSGGMGGISFRKLVGRYSGKWGSAINITTLEERDIGFKTVDGVEVADDDEILDLSNGTDTVRLLGYDNSFVKVYFGVPPENRPILVNSGTLVTLDGKPAMDAPAVTRMSLTTSLSSTIRPVPVSIVTLAKIDTLRQRNLVTGDAVSYGYYHGGTLSGYNGIGVRDKAGNVFSLNDEDFNRRLGFYAWDGTDIRIGSNNSGLTLFTGGDGPFPLASVMSGATASAQSLSGKFQELLFFETNKAGEYSEIISNLNDYYSIW